jgi:hypothetical protein
LKKKETPLWIKKLGWTTFWFFVIKGTISTLLILWAGSQFFAC